MRKSVIGVPTAKPTAELGDWLDLEELASVEVTSEDENYPVESVFAFDGTAGWRANGKGPQVIRLLFREPQAIRRIHLEFVETQVSRMQEFSLRWSPSPDTSFKEIVRQQWNFSPDGSKSEVEDYKVELAHVRVLELTITPDVSGGSAVASLAQWRVA